MDHESDYFWIGTLLSAALFALIPNYSTKPAMYEKAEKLCENNGGIERFRANAIVDSKVFCNNGAVFSFGGGFRND